MNDPDQIVTSFARGNQLSDHLSTRKTSRRIEKRSTAAAYQRTGQHQFLHHRPSSQGPGLIS